VKKRIPTERFRPLTVARRLIILLFLVISGFSCMYKSVMEGEADDIKKARIYNYQDNNYLVTIEYVYQVMSKESGRGYTMITGHNDPRISVYDLDSGILIARKKTGRIDRYPFEFLGCTEGNLWFYSFENGIHTLNPANLEIKLTQDQILKNNPELGERLATCEPYQLPQYFQFNEITRHVVLTDQQGYRYFLDTEILAAKKIDEEYRSFDPRRNRQLETYISSPPPVLAMNGDLRKQIMVDNREVNSSLTFLEGQFIVDRNPVRTYEGINDHLSAEMEKIEALNNQLLRLNDLNGGRGPAYRTPERDTLNRLHSQRRNSENLIRELEEGHTTVAREGYSHRFSHLLSPDTSSFFVLHSSGRTKDANMMISRIKRKGSTALTELWTTEIPGIFHNPDAARETNSFKVVFSKGSPDFSYSQFEMEDNKLIIIWMLHIICIDMETGTLLWKFRV